MLNSKEELKKAEAELLKKVDSKNSINQTSYDDIVSKYLLSEEDTILLDKFVSENNIDIIDDLDNSTISNLGEDTSSLSIWSLYKKDINKYHILSKQEEAELGKEIKLGSQEALDMLVNSNLRLVIAIASKFSTFIKNNPNISFEDLISFGNQGLIKAAKDFDYTLGNKFSTFASYWIRQAIQRGIYSQAHQIKIPSNIGELHSKIVKTISSLTNSLKREPTYQEIADKMGNISPEKVESILSNWNNVVSLEDERNSSDKPLIDYLTYDNQDDDIESNLNQLNIGLNSLKDREKDMINKYYGINGHQKMTLEEIGNQYGISKERVRQLISRALVKMRDQINKSK